jgi:DinB superfamily
MDKDHALADFDKARGEWEAVLAGVPDDALGYLKPGDDYAIGGLQVHVNQVLVHYRRVLEGLIGGGFASMKVSDPPKEIAETKVKTRAGLTAAERVQSLGEMRGLHAKIVEAITRLPEGDWSRKAPVVYGEGQDPFPTSPEDVIGWLRDHYREHVHQAPELVEVWRSSR